jgi:hypothetical protein
MPEVQTVVEHPLGEREPTMVKLNKYQKAALKGLPKPGWFIHHAPFLNALNCWADYDELLDHGYIVEHFNMFYSEPDIGITNRGLTAIKKKKKAPSRS